MMNQLIEDNEDLVDIISKLEGMMERQVIPKFVIHVLYKTLNISKKMIESYEPLSEIYTIEGMKFFAESVQDAVEKWLEVDKTAPAIGQIYVYSPTHCYMVLYTDTHNGENIEVDILHRKELK